MPDATLLRQALADLAVASKSDADAAVALSAPVLTTRAERITYTTLGSVWGPVDAAVFSAKLDAAMQQGNPLAAYVNKLLGGPGFDATNKATAPTAQQLVAAGLCTAEQVAGVLNVTSYLAGSPVTADDVTAARAALARAAAESDLRSAWAGVCARGVGLIDAGAQAGKLPTLDELRGA